MLYELRVYDALPGQLPRLLRRFEQQTLGIWERLGISPIAFWTTLIGGSNNRLTYVLQWISLAEREEKWSSFQRDPEWRRVRDESERDGQIVARIRNQILAPTSFSQLQ
jgi:hypothetical protein